MPIGVLSSYLVVSSKSRTFVPNYNNIKTKYNIKTIITT